MWEHKNRKNMLAETDNFTVLGKDVTFKGVVQFEGTVQLESCFEGEIHTRGVLVVGEHALIRGTITVGTLISGGKIQGNVSATDKVQLLKSAVQIGDIHSPTFSIEEGAYFKGSADMCAGHSVDETIQSIETVPDLAIRRDKQRPHLIQHESGG